jgi:hypothetical protein
VPQVHRVLRVVLVLKVQKVLQEIKGLKVVLVLKVQKVLQEIKGLKVVVDQ